MTDQYKTALVVDDGPVERLAGKSMLEKLGFAVAVAGSAEEALALFEQALFDVVLCDIAMPGMGGIALLEACRQMRKPPMVIMISTHDDAEHAVASLKRGAYAYLTKPLRIDHLRTTLNEAIARYEKEQSPASYPTNAARHDSLTNLINRNEFAVQLAERLRHTLPAARGALLLFKISGVNHVNHSYGRAEGDRILQLAANALAQHVSPTDLLARFGGDVFSAYLPDLGHEDTNAHAGAIVHAVEAVKIVLSGDAFSLNLVGGGVCVHNANDVEELLNRADFALHLARQQSRSKVHIYSEADEARKLELSHQLNTLSLVRAALDNPSRMAMHYQPITDLQSGQVSHYEALLRLLDENGKPCNTGELIKTCEVFGLIERLDLAIVARCLAEADRLPKGAGVAINLSGKSIGDPALLQFIESRMAELAIDPHRIIFELTETAAFYNLDEVRHFVKRIKELGCRFALDDFGVGFSSFYYIKELDFDYLKLDGSFIAKLPKSPNDQVFVRAMVEISRVFGLSVIAEWVEDLETVEMLRELNVAYGQGWYFGKPMPLLAAD
ncbi:MAG: EAL domain-containing protein [Burkholderiales bacterium]|nr:EAL domain-containing protein [Burkholderiales bacterium]